MQLLPTEFIQINAYINRLEKLGVEIELIPENEDISPDDQFDDQSNVDFVTSRYNAGNIWAWFCAHVTVKYKGFEANDYLGCCSYKNEKDFKKDGYFKDMVITCINEINSEIEYKNNEIIKRMEIRKAKRTLAKYGYIVALAV